MIRIVPGKNRQKIEIFKDLGEIARKLDLAETGKLNGPLQRFTQLRWELRVHFARVCSFPGKIVARIVTGAVFLVKEKKIFFVTFGQNSVTVI